MPIELLYHLHPQVSVAVLWLGRILSSPLFHGAVRLVRLGLSQLLPFNTSTK